MPSLWVALYALIAAGIVNFPAMRGAFVFDDFHLPFADPHAAEMPWRFWVGGVRPVLMASYWANYVVSGTNPASYHVFGVLLHAAAGFLVYLLLKRLIPICGMRLDAGRAALFGAGVFLLHPLQTEAVDYIAGRSEVLAAVFVLGAWLIFSERFAMRTSRRTALAVMLPACGAVLSKESGICVAGIIAATDFYWRKGSIGSQFRNRLWLYVPLLGGGAGATVLILATLSGSTSAGFGFGSGPLQYAITECRVIVEYLRLFALPLGQNADWQAPVVHFPVPALSWAFVLLIVILAGVIVWLFRTMRAVSFGMLIFLIALAPTSSFVPIQDAMAERRMYLPMVGLIIAVLGIADRLRISRKTLQTAAVVWTGLLAIACFERSKVWASDFSLWSDVTARAPGNARAHAGLGSALMRANDCPGAVLEYQAVVKLQGMDEMSGMNLAAAYECSRQPELALATYRGLAAAHATASVYSRIGFMEALRENTAGALEALETAVRLDPYYAPAYAYRGLAKLAVNDEEAARKDFSTALTLDPRNAVALQWIAKLPEGK